MRNNDIYDNLRAQINAETSARGEQAGIDMAQSILRLRSDPIERNPAIDFLAKRGAQYLAPFMDAERAERLVADINRSIKR